MSTQELDAPESGFPAGALLSIGAALVLSLLVLRALLSGSAGPAGVGGQSRTPAVASMPVPAAPQFAATRPAVPPAPLSTPDRLSFANIPDAGQQLGLPVRVPRVLPPDVVPLYVGWEAGGPTPAPGSVPPGRLLAWYYTLRDGVSLTLEQGAGVGVSAGKAPAGSHGAVTLADGTTLVWVRGHFNLTAGPLGLVEEWLGNELMLGVPPASGVGWRLISAVYSLDDLVRIAEGLR